MITPAHLVVTCGGDAPNCPFMDAEPFANYRECTRSGHRHLGPHDFPDRNDPPEWCPLRVAPVLVEVKP